MSDCHCHNEPEPEEEIVECPGCGREFQCVSVWGFEYSRCKKCREAIKALAIAALTPKDTP